METHQYPILEFDSTREAIIEPHLTARGSGAPEHCVVCFFREVIEPARERFAAKPIHKWVSEMFIPPVYEFQIDGRRLAVYHSGVCAPLAAAMLEEVISLGCRKFIVCGSAGVLDKSIAVGHIVVPATAVRDEGTSYHYLPAGREISASAEAVDAIKSVLDAHKCLYLVSKTWTTDAIFRETSQKVQLRKSEGCLTVEMEAAAFFAVAQFRGVTLGQLLYGGDDVGGTEWDPRHSEARASAREKLFWLAVEACLKL